MRLGSLLLLILVISGIVLPFIPQTNATYEDYSIVADFSQGNYYQTYYNGSLQNLFWSDNGNWQSQCYNLTDFYVYGWETIWLGLGTIEGILWVQNDGGAWNPLSINPLNATVNTPLNGDWAFYFDFILHDGETDVLLLQFTLFVYADHFIPRFINSVPFYIIMVMMVILGILTLIYLKKERFI
jgi:hypothetical protein